MEEEQVPTLFEVFWFYRNILSKPPLFPPTSQTPVQDKTQIEKPTNSRLRSLRQQSLSSDLSTESYTFSPSSVLPTTRLNKILSGKEVGEVTEKIMKQETERTKKKEKVGRRKKWGAKSLSELELEELKGFMDLGFTFSESEIDSRLISIVPGLGRVGRKAGEEEEQDVDESAVSRPYLAEAWTVDERKENPLTDWRISMGSDAADMKNHLKLWAQAVASRVRS